MCGESLRPKGLSPPYLLLKSEGKDLTRDSKIVSVWFYYMDFQGTRVVLLHGLQDICSFKKKYF
jgi:hypothetical protein